MTERKRAETRKQEEPGIDLQLADNVNQDQFFEGKVTIDNWAMTDKQRMLRSLSFETKVHDIFNPSYSSESEGTRANCEILLNENSSNASENLESIMSGNSNHTEIERCQNSNSENLMEDEIRESII